MTNSHGIPSLNEVCIVKARMLKIVTSPCDHYRHQFNIIELNFIQQVACSQEIIKCLDQICYFIIMILT